MFFDSLAKKWGKLKSFKFTKKKFSKRIKLAMTAQSKANTAAWLIDSINN
jgi:hypothetical protein